MASSGYSIIPLLDLFISGAYFAVSYHAFGSIWFACSAHMAWNYTQDFIFGLPNSGMESASSIFVSATNNENIFFFDEVFGLEGAGMALIVEMTTFIVILLIGMLMMKKKQKTEELNQPLDQQ